MAAPVPGPAQRPIRPIEPLLQMVNEVVVATGKTFKAAKADGKGNVTEAAASMDARIPIAVEKFNMVLDDIELEILKAKSILLRDLNQVRARRKPPPPKQAPVAPPAPMESPIMTAKAVQPSPFKPNVPGPNRPSPVIKQESKPVAPFPNMGLDLASPEIKHAPTPSPKPVHRLKGPKTPMHPAAAAAAAGRPASAPPKKEAKISPPQVPRSAGPPQTAPFPPGMQGKASSVPAPNMSAPTAPQAPAAAPATGNEAFFTDMSFAPPPGETQGQAHTQQQQAQQTQPQPPQPEIDLTKLAGGGNTAGLSTGTTTTLGGSNGAGSGPADVAKMEDNGAVDDEANSKDLFDLDGMDMGYGLSEDNGDDNFNNLYFHIEGDNNGISGGFDNNFFNQ